MRPIRNIYEIDTDHSAQATGPVTSRAFIPDAPWRTWTSKTRRLSPAIIYAAASALMHLIGLDMFLPETAPAVPASPVFELVFEDPILQTASPILAKQAEPVRLKSKPVAGQRTSPAPSGKTQDGVPVASDQVSAEDEAQGPGPIGNHAQSLPVQSTAETGPDKGALPSDAVADYIAEIMRRLEQAKRYPALARRRSEQGTVMIEFSINGEGHSVGAIIVRSSGSSLLDRGALETVEAAQRLPRPPEAIAHARFSVPIRFTLNDARS